MPADLRDPLPVARRRRGGGERRAHDRLGHERGNRARTCRGDHAVQLVDQLLGRAQRLGAGVTRPIRVSSADVAEPAQPALVWTAKGLAPGQVERAERVAVVARPARDDDPAVHLAPRELGGAGQLEGRLDGLRATRDRVDRGIPERKMRTERRCVALERLVGERAAMGVRDARHLVRDRIGDLAPAVAHVDHDRATGCVEVLASVGVDDGGPVGLHRDRRVGVRRATEHAPAHRCPPNNGITRRL